MKVGVWIYGLGTALTGILDIAWGAFDASHQPIQSLGKNFAGEHILAWVAGLWLLAAGLAILWQRSRRIGAAASAIAYLIFAALWLPRYHAGIHAYGWRMAVVFGISFGLAQQVTLVAPAIIVYVSASLVGCPVARESSDRRTLDAGIASRDLRLVSSDQHSHLRKHRAAVDGVWIFLGGVHRSRLCPGRNCNLFGEDGCPGCQASCIDAVAV